MSKSTAPQLSFAVLAIGDEVLRGEIINGNAAYLSDRAFGLGLHPGEHAVVADDPQMMESTLRRLCRAHQVVFVTGGLGPTEDDRTVDVVSAIVGVAPVVHPPSLEAMRARFERHKFHITPNNERQVRVPGGARVLPNRVGLAPGFHVRLGDADVFFFPGVPVEMHAIFEDHVVPALRQIIGESGGLSTSVKTWHVYGMGESHIDHRLSGLLNPLEGQGVRATLHYRAAQTEVHVRVVLRHPAESEAEAQQQLAAVSRDVHARLGDAVYGEDDDTFVSVVQRMFREYGRTLAFAESCTGGYAGQLLTEEPGASQVFLGSIVSYANQVKMNVLGVEADTIALHGAVSEPCARQMALGARRVLGADVAVAITGVAGDVRDQSSPSAPGQKPVGTVCFAVAAASGVAAETRLISGGRDRVRRAAAFVALDLARKALLTPISGSGATHNVSSS